MPMGFLFGPSSEYECSSSALGDLARSMHVRTCTPAKCCYSSVV